MAPLSSCQVCPSTEEFQSSWVAPSQTSRRMKQKKKHKSSVWSLASWNVRSLLDVEGSLETARSRDEVENAESSGSEQKPIELGRALYWLLVDQSQGLARQRSGGKELP